MKLLALMFILFSRIGLATEDSPDDGIFVGRIRLTIVAGHGFCSEQSLSDYGTDARLEALRKAKLSGYSKDECQHAGTAVIENTFDHCLIEASYKCARKQATQPGSDSVDLSLYESPEPVIGEPFAFGEYRNWISNGYPIEQYCRGEDTEYSANKFYVRDGAIENAKQKCEVAGYDLCLYRSHKYGYDLIKPGKLTFSKFKDEVIQCKATATFFGYKRKPGKSGVSPAPGLPQPPTGKAAAGIDWRGTESINDFQLKKLFFRQFTFSMSGRPIPESRVKDYPELKEFVGSYSIYSRIVTTRGCNLVGDSDVRGADGLAKFAYSQAGFDAKDCRSPKGIVIKDNGTGESCETLQQYFCRKGVSGDNLELLPFDIDARDGNVDIKSRKREFEISVKFHKVCDQVSADERALSGKVANLVGEAAVLGPNPPCAPKASRATQDTSDECTVENTIECSF